MKTTAEELRERGRDYLMQVRPNDLTASATLKALGYGENGLSDEAVSLHPSEGMKTLPELKLKWQGHNRDNGLSWNEVSTLVDEVAALQSSEGEISEDLKNWFADAWYHL